MLNLNANKEKLKMQTNLFSGGQKFFEDALAKLNNFEFNECITLLNEARSIDPALANINFFREIAISCKNSGLNPQSTHVEIADIWQELKARQLELGGASQACVEMLRLFSYRLRELDPFDSKGLLPGCDYFLHESACLLHLKNFQAAHDLLIDALDQHGENIPARYWGYLGDAAFAQQNFFEANSAYVKLLAANPFDIDWATLKNKALRTLFTEITANFSIKMAYAHLPYRAWSEGIIEIHSGNIFIAELLKKFDDSFEQNNFYDKARNTHIFSLYVFAEQARTRADLMPERRARMKELNPELFQEYLQRIA
ncbi:MAG: hypothetical protein DWQ05_22135 [Calditrichaeota bacterium]|nr:MAG: hypothetical protein DWQ05_22135 [Calditrichota bacterium]